MSKKNALIESDWLFKASKYFITIKDILSMKEGDKDIFILFDRNLFDSTHNNKENKIYKPEHYFRGYSIIYTHVYGLFGKMVFYDNNKLLDSWYLDHYDYWQVNLSTGWWTKLTDGKLTQLPKPQPKIDFPNGLENKLWNTLPKNTFIGWRGPMMRLSDLKKMPNIYWNKKDDNLNNVNKIKIYA